MKTKHLIFALLYIVMQSLYAQNTVFTKGTFYKPNGKPQSIVTYTVNGISYKVPYKKYAAARGNYNFTNLLSYYIGYDSLNPQNARVYYNLPYFDAARTQAYPATTNGKIIYLYPYFCEYQFYAMDNSGTKKLIIARQAISANDIKNNNIHPGTCLKVEYLPQKPDANIIYYTQPSSDNMIDYKKPKLSMPNGIMYEFETSLLFPHSTSLNPYLHTNGQPNISNILPSFTLNYGYNFKSGLSWSVGYGGAHNLTMVKLGVGYTRQITRRFYTNFSLNFNYMNYSIPAFANGQITRLADTTQFSYSNWYFNPKIDFMWRLSSHNNLTCSFLKLGVGVFCNLNPDKKWAYEIGHEATG